MTAGFFNFYLKNLLIALSYYLETKKYLIDIFYLKINSVKSEKHKN